MTHPGPKVREPGASASGGDPDVTVTIITHNARSSLPLAVASVFAQTLSDWECLIVDDGSTDGTHEWLSTIEDPRVRCVRLDRNRGRGFARQLALDEARGRYVAPLDADDWMYPERLERQVSALDADPRWHLATCSMVVSRPDGRVLGILAPRVHGRMHRLARPGVCFGSIVVARAHAARIGFDRTLTRSEDVGFLTALLLEQEPLVIDEPLYVYRPSAPSREDILRAYECSRRAYAAFLDRFPLAARVQMTKQTLRWWTRFFIPSQLNAGLVAWSRGRQMTPPTEAQLERHARALSVVRQLLVR